MSKYHSLIEFFTFKVQIWRRNRHNGASDQLMQGVGDTLSKSSKTSIWWLSWKIDVSNCAEYETVFSTPKCDSLWIDSRLVEARIQIRIIEKVHNVERKKHNEGMTIRLWKHDIWIQHILLRQHNRDFFHKICQNCCHRNIYVPFFVWGPILTVTYPCLDFKNKKTMKEWQLDNENTIFGFSTFFYVD